MPPRTIACNWQVDAVAGTPLAVVGPNGSFYSGASRGDNGPSTLISANNGGFGTDCGAPNPTGSAQLDCVQGGVVLTLGNTGELDASFTVTVDGTDFPVADVGPNSQRTEFIPVAEDTTVHVTVVSGETTLVDQDFSRNCEEPPPTANAALDCARGGVVVTVGNTATIATTYSVLKGATEVASGPLAANNGSAEVVVPFAEDETATVTVNVGGETILGPTSFTRNCTNPQPSARAVLDCASGGVAVTLVNSGDQAATFDVLKGDTVVADDVLVAGPGEASVLVPMAEDETAQITVVSGGSTVLNQSFTANCVRPSVSAAVACAAGGVTVTLTNDGDSPASFSITKGDGAPAIHVVAGHASTQVTVAYTEGETAQLVVLEGATTLLDQSYTFDCEKPTASATHTCAAEGILVELANGGENPAEFTVEWAFPVGAWNVDKVTVPGGAIASTVVPVDEDATVTITVTSGGVEILNQTITRNCIEPHASVVHECSDDGVTITLSNDGENAALFRIEVDSLQFGDEISVPAGEPVVVTVPIDEDQTINIVVTEAETAAPLFQEDISRNCEEPEVEAIQMACAQGGAAITLTNSGENDATFEITKNGDAVGDDVVVPGDGSVDVVVPMDEGETATIVVTSNGEEIERATLTRNCVEPAATWASSCTEKGAVVTLTNTGELAATITVTKNGSVIDTVSVTPGATVTRTYAMQEDETATFRATGAGVDTGNQSVTLDCQEVGGTKFTNTLPTTGGPTAMLVTLAGVLLLVGGLMVAIPARPQRRRPAY